ncbi:rhamnulokinase [Pelagicoccus mobilis]|uniref:Rhamnulokinase n=1 Tax=Pelagicoccus mobilis TaxID=415221 RepID=A0A934VPA8_9BACT|nr:FGGY-family carbohydrate kinase [Pelagicoccus mobilis]MBK1875344.1 hypothetical protein [Pelagicoccus mobilis]
MSKSKSVSVAAVDMGATSGRVFVAKWDGEHLEMSESHRFRHSFASLGSHCYWEMGALYREITDGLRLAREAEPKLASCGLDFWGVDHALLLKDGRLAHPIYSYRDERTRLLMPDRESEEAAELYARTGIPPVVYNSSIQLKETLSAMPALRDSVERCLFLPDYVNYLLSGAKENEVSIASTSQLLSLDGGGFDAETLNRMGIPQDWFSEPSKCGKVLGSVESEKGLEGLSVSLVPGHDTSCAFEGAPGATEDDFVVSTGTWVLAGAFSDKPFPTELGLQKGISHERCGDGGLRPTKILLGLWMVERLFDSFGVHPQSQQDWSSLLHNVEVEPVPGEVLDTGDSSLFNPSDMREAIDAQLKSRGLPLPASLAAYLRLVYESIAESVAAALKEFESALGRRYPRIVLIGGGAKNELLCRSLNERSGCPVYAYPTEAAVIGNAAYQLKALGAIDSVSEFRKGLAKQFD